MTSAESKECQVCREKPATAEAVFMFGRTVDALMAASVRYASDLEAWPSVWLCDQCIQTTEPAFAALDDLPAADLVGITTPLLVTICRLTAGTWRRLT